MVLKIGRNINTCSDATLTSVALNSSTSTKISDECPSATLCRVYFLVSNPSEEDVWIKFQAASVDNDKKGIFIGRRSTEIILLPDNIYIGEISAIAAEGNPTIYITEF